QQSSVIFCISLSPATPASLSVFSPVCPLLPCAQFSSPAPSSSLLSSPGCSLPAVASAPQMPSASRFFLVVPPVTSPTAFSTALSPISSRSISVFFLGRLLIPGRPSTSPTLRSPLAPFSSFLTYYFVIIP